MIGSQSMQPVDIRPPVVMTKRMKLSQHFGTDMHGVKSPTKRSNNGLSGFSKQNLSTKHGSTSTGELMPIRKTITPSHSGNQSLNNFYRAAHQEYRYSIEGATIGVPAGWHSPESTFMTCLGDSNHKNKW